VRGDPDGLRQVFLNLVKNSIEAMPEGGAVKISASHDSDYARVFLTDTGPGIPEEVRSSVLRPFFTTKLTGTGLGLSVSASLVERMNGRLNIRSEPGKGTEVVVTLPMAEPHKVQVGG